MSIPADRIHSRIFRIRGQRVILDTDLAQLYGGPTKRFNEAFKRNRHRFPANFAFQVSREEGLSLESQIATSSTQAADEVLVEGNWSQIATSSKAKHRGATYRPWAFTEHGAIMATNILRSDRAMEMSVYVVRAFVIHREALSTNAVILKRLAEIDRTLLEHDSALQILWKRLQPLLTPPPDPPRRKIGFYRHDR